MLPDVARTILPQFWRGVRKNHVENQRDVKVVAFDTETCFGRVFASGFYDGEKFECVYGLQKNHFRDFLLWLKRVAWAADSTVVCFAHYLKFDLSVLLWPVVNAHGFTVRKASSKIVACFVNPRCEIEIYLTRPTFAKIRFGKRTVQVLDTWAFYGASLKRVLEMIGGEEQKLDKPRDLGKRVIPKREVLPYLRADVVGVHRAGLELIKLHRRFGVRLCVSLPQLSGRIFRHHYLKTDFAVPPRGLLSAALLSYHGGKNTFCGRQGWYQAYDLDIRSAFPEAMAQLPNFENGKWVAVKSFKSEHGIYRVSGVAKNCKWGVIFDHGFRKVRGQFDNLWITGYELKESLCSGECVYRRIEGWSFDDHGGQSAFRAFVGNFFRQKEESRNPLERSFFKLILNSLYGKFIQRKEDDYGNRVAGSMFDPAIASLITGFVRAKIHRLEHRYNALHTATDGILTVRRPLASDLGDGIGELKQEVFGPCLILRNKLYLHYDQKGKLVKRGLHGFEGSPEDLLKMYREKKRYYKIERLTSWAESWHLGIPPGCPLKRDKILTAIQ